MLHVKKLSKTYYSAEGNQAVLKDLDLNLQQGDSLAILGESGSGKSTLINIIAGLEEPTKGIIELNGLNLWSCLEHQRAKIRRERLAVIFQQYNLIPTLTIRENILFHAKLVGKVDPNFVNQIVRTLKLETILEKYPEQTSGGQQQRVAIARAVAAKPNLILADEPTGNLDEENTQRVIEMLNLLLKENNTSLLIATHSNILSAQLDAQVILTKGTLKKHAIY